MKTLDSLSAKISIAVLDAFLVEFAERLKAVTPRPQVYRRSSDNTALIPDVCNITYKDGQFLLTPVTVYSVDGYRNTFDTILKGQEFFRTADPEKAMQVALAWHLLIGVEKFK